MADWYTQYRTRGWLCRPYPPWNQNVHEPVAFQLKASCGPARVPASLSSTARLPSPAQLCVFLTSNSRESFALRSASSIRFPARFMSRTDGRSPSNRSAAFLMGEQSPRRGSGSPSFFTRTVSKCSTCSPCLSLQEPQGSHRTHPVARAWKWAGLDLLEGVAVRFGFAPSFQEVILPSRSLPMIPSSEGSYDGRHHGLGFEYLVMKNAQRN